MQSKTPKNLANSKAREVKTLMKKPTPLRIILSIIVTIAFYLFLTSLFSINEIIDYKFNGLISSLTTLWYVKLLISALIGFLVLIYQEQRLNSVENKTVGNGQYGNARWMTDKEKRESYTYVKDGKEKIPGFVIGREGNEWIVETGDKTVCQVAPPGGGKTKCVFVPTLYYNARVNKNTKNRGASLLSLDVKSENFKSSGYELKQSGYNVLFLDFRDPSGSYHFNLMNGVNSEIDLSKNAKSKEKSMRHYARAERYAKQVSSSIVKNIMGETRDSSSDFFDKTAQGLITGLQLMVSQYGSDNERHIISVFKLIIELNGLIDNGNIEAGKQKSKLMELLQFIDDERITDYVGASVNADVRTSMNVFSSALAKLIEFIDAELEQMICDHSSEINAKSFVESPTAIFVICPDEDSSRHFFASLFIRYFTTQLIDMAETSPGMVLPRKVLCLWDEFGNMPAIKDVDALFTAARSRGIRFLYSLQSFNQLQKNYNKTYADIILDASQILMFTFLSPGAIETAKKLSEILGNRTVLAGNINKRQRPFELWEQDETTGYQMIKQPLMFPDDILSIPIGTWVVIKTGGASEQTKMKTKTPMYSEYCTVHPEYSESIKNEYHDIKVLNGDKIRRLGAIAKNKLTVGMFD